MTNATTLLDAAPPPVRTLVGDATATPIRDLSIGSVFIGFPVVQAALSGYSDGPMRIVARRLGASYTLAEVMIDRFVLETKDRGKTRHHFTVTDEEHPVGGQLMGSDPLQFGPAAKRLVAAGFDVIDINFGCPVKSAAGSCRGGYLLGRPETALEIVDRVRQSVPEPIPVTLKMRRGLDDSTESRERFFTILDGAFARGVAAVTVHGRTVEQKYVGPSNWDFLRDVKRHAGTKAILGSGDLFTARGGHSIRRCETDHSHRPRRRGLRCAARTKRSTCAAGVPVFRREPKTHGCSTAWPNLLRQVGNRHRGRNRSDARDGAVLGDPLPRRGSCGRPHPDRP